MTPKFGLILRSPPWRSFQPVDVAVFARAPIIGGRGGGKADLMFSAACQGRWWRALETAGRRSWACVFKVTAGLFSNPVFVLCDTSLSYYLAVLGITLFTVRITIVGNTVTYLPR